MKVGYYPISICSITAPTLLSFLISILPESYRLAGDYHTKRVACHSCGAKEGADGSTSVRVVICGGKVQAMGMAAESNKVPHLPFSAKPNAAGDARAVLRACQKSVHSFNVSLPHTTHSAANGTPSIEKWSSVMHVSHSTHNISNLFTNSWELNVFSKYRLATGGGAELRWPWGSLGKGGTGGEDPLAAPGLQKGAEGDLVGSAAMSLCSRCTRLP